MYLKDLAAKIPVYCILLVHGFGMGEKMAAGDIDKFWENRTVKAIIPLDAYKAEIVVEGE